MAKEKYRKRYAKYNKKPWKVPLSPRMRKRYKQYLWDHGKLSPNFSKDEAASGDGVGIPSSLRHHAQEHAFRLERVRHILGDKSMGALSWYRSPQHNANVGGATFSKHKEAHATDWSSQERARLGGEKFDAAMEKVFKKGGIGRQGSSGYPVRHVDNGPNRRWYY